VLEIGQQIAALYKVDGSLLWKQAITGSIEAVWLTDGAIAIVTAAGIARLDPATGAITATRCGWKFGLATKPHPPAPAIEPVCTRP
jgi:outer membrane protein assembly factor BamB